MKLGATVGMRDDPDKFASYAKRLEDVGVEYLWTGEAYSADAVSTMGFLAAVTRKAQIGSSILPLYSRTPTLMAMTAVGLDKLSRGRFVLGLGASGPQVIEGFHGVPYDAPLARTREIIEICRSVWRRDRLVHDGANYQVPLAEGQGTGLGKALKIMDHPVRERIPIFVASLGPKNVAMTAELAEGWLPLHYWPDRAYELWGSPLEEGKAARSPELQPLEIVAGGLAGHRRRRRRTARSGPPHAGPLLRGHGRQGQELLQRRAAALRLREGGRADSGPLPRGRSQGVGSAHPRRVGRRDVAHRRRRLRQGPRGCVPRVRRHRPERAARRAERIAGH